MYYVPIPMMAICVFVVSVQPNISSSIYVWIGGRYIN